VFGTEVTEDQAAVPRLNAASSYQGRPTSTMCI